MGSREWVNYFSLLVSIAFALHGKLPLYQPMGVHTSTFSVFSPIPLGAVWS